jgi:hypothetical protein
MGFINKDSIWQWLSDFRKWLKNIFKQNDIKVHQPIWSAYLYKKVPINNSKPCFTIETGELIDSVYSDSIKECIDQLYKYTDSFNASFGIILKSKIAVSEIDQYEWSIKSKYGCVIILKKDKNAIAFKHLSGTVKSYLDNDIKVDSIAIANVKLEADTLYEIEIRYWILNDDQLEIMVSNKETKNYLDNSGYLKK